MKRRALRFESCNDTMTISSARVGHTSRPILSSPAHYRLAVPITIENHSFLGPSGRAMMRAWHVPENKDQNNGIDSDICTCKHLWAQFGWWMTRRQSPVLRGSCFSLRWSTRMQCCTAAVADTLPVGWAVPGVAVSRTVTRTGQRTGCFCLFCSHFCPS